VESGSRADSSKAREAVYFDASALNAYARIFGIKYSGFNGHHRRCPADVENPSAHMKKGQLGLQNRTRHGRYRRTFVHEAAEHRIYGNTKLTGFRL